MKKFTMKFALLSTILGLCFSFSVLAQTPTVDSVATVMGISGTVAYSGCYVSSNGGSAITEKGICWSTSPNPTISDNKFPAYKISTPKYEPCAMSGLTPNTNYYVRAYATNSSGTGYSPQKELKTSANNAEAKWSLFSDLAAVTTGDVTASLLDTLHFGYKLSFKQNSGGTAGSSVLFPVADWLKLPTTSQLTLAYNSDKYLAFSVSSTSQVFTINKLTICALGYKTGSLVAAFYYSLDNFATAGIPLGTATVNDSVRTQYTKESFSLSSANPSITTPMGRENISFSPAITVKKGETAYFRVYVWGKASATMLIKDLIVSGTTDVVSNIPVIENQSVEIYPTLANQIINVKSASVIKTVNILSVEGRLVYSAKPNALSATLNVAGIRNGLYLVTVETNTGTVIRKAQIVK